MNIKVHHAVSTTRLHVHVYIRFQEYMYVYLAIGVEFKVSTCTLLEVYATSDKRAGLYLYLSSDLKRNVLPA